MRQRLILHVGTHKTGTTAIQDALFRHRDSFARSGILYDPGHRYFGGPKTAHHGLAHALARYDTDDRRALARYAKAIEREAKSAECIVVSAEPFLRQIASRGEGADRAARRRVFLQRVADYFSGYDVTVSVYLRRPDKFAVSLYKENLVRSALASPFADYILQKSEAFDYGERLAPFHELFGSVSLHSYEATVARGLVPGFFADHGLPLSPDYKEERTRSGIGAVGALWLARAKANGGVDERDLQRRWDFLLSQASGEVLADPEGADLWTSGAQRQAFLARSLAGFEHDDFWDMPTDEPRVLTWSEAEQSAAEAAYLDWRSKNIARLQAREALGVAPYQSDSSLPALRFRLLRGYFGTFGRAGSQ